MFIEPDDLEHWKSAFDSNVNLFHYDDAFLTRHIEMNIIEKSNRCHCAKSGQRSTQLRLKGNEKVREEKYLEAIKFYNNSLCNAEIASENVSLAYANRSLCFLKLAMYDKSFADIELAISANYAEKSLSKLEERRVFCLKQINRGMQVEKEQPKLDFQEDEQFPGMANVLKFQYNAQFGRHLIAKCDIDVGKVVLVEEAFVATPVMSPSIQVCSNCFKVSMNFIACDNCTDAVFCDQECKKDGFHEISCGNSIRNSDHLVPYAVRSVLIALSIFPDIGSLNRFVKNVLNENEHEVPLGTSAMKSKYRAFLKLNFRLEDEEKYNSDNRSYDLTMELMSQPIVKEKIQSKNDERFLMFLSAIHLNILYCNSFQNEVAGFLFVIYKYVSERSPLNTPNLMRYVTANKIVLTTSRPIKRGDQLLIASAEACCVVQTRFKCEINAKLYGEGHVFVHDRNVLDHLRKREEFRPLSSQQVEDDPDYQHISNEMKCIDFGNDSACSILKQKCLALLTKYNRSAWSIQLKRVSELFENLSNQNYLH